MLRYDLVGNAILLGLLNSVISQSPTERLPRGTTRSVRIKPTPRGAVAPTTHLKGLLDMLLSEEGGAGRRPAWIWWLDMCHRTGPGPRGRFSNIQAGVVAAKRGGTQAGRSGAARLNSAAEAAGCDLWRTRRVFELRHNWVKNQQPAADARPTQRQRREERASPHKGDKVNSPG